jgi:predicted metal-dependent HD superfamily phosphohydrolase
MADLFQRWTQCFADLDVARPPDCAFEELSQRYSEPHRAYHTLQHLVECFDGFDRARHLMRKPGEVAMALFYHDAIYDTHARDNEDRSAELARDVLGEYCPASHEVAASVTSLILATRHDAIPASADARVLVDIDLSILGAPTDRFDEYERQIRFEYSWVSAPDFRIGRAKVLEAFLARDTIYSTDMFRAHLEQAARNSLKRSLATLGDRT